MNQLQKSYTTIAQTYYEANQTSILTAHWEKFLSYAKPNGVVLDVGCGTGRDTAVLRQHNFTVYSFDLTHAMMKTAVQHGVRGNFVQADMRQLPITLQADAVWAAASLLHIERGDMAATLRQFARLLKPGGIFYCTVKKGADAEWTKLSYGHAVPRRFVYWQPDEWNQQLTQAGFSILDGWDDKSRTVDWLVRFCKRGQRSELERED